MVCWWNNYSMHKYPRALIVSLFERQDFTRFPSRSYGRISNGRKTLVYVQLLREKFLLALVPQDSRNVNTKRVDIRVSFLGQRANGKFSSPSECKSTFMLREKFNFNFKESTAACKHSREIKLKCSS